MAGFLVSFGALHYGFFTRNVLLDTPIYERYGDAVVHHAELPYRDFGLEYPPVALVVFAIPSLFAPAHDFGGYTQAFETLMVLCGVVASALVALVLARQGAPLSRLIARSLFAGLAPLLLGPVVLSRYDLWPTVLTIAALGALVWARFRLAFVLLALATAAKVYPAVLLPLAAIQVWRVRGRREAGVCLAIAGAVLAVVTLPFAVAAPHGVWESLTGQAGRPLQIESLGASFLLVAHTVAGLGVTVLFSHGSDNLGGHPASVLASAQTVIGAVALVALWVAYARGAAQPGRLLRYAAACVCAFVAFDKVLSPQYMVWLIPVVALVPGVRGDVSVVLLAAVLVITQLWFPSHYLSLAYDLDPKDSWFVLARDLALVALFATLAWPAERAVRWRAGTVGAVALLAVGAVGAATASPRASLGTTHSALLNETGTASTCEALKPVPGVTYGNSVYQTVSVTSTGSTPECIRTTLSAAPGAQLFAAAYAGSFDPAQPQARYLGDPGICTNIPSASGPETRFAIRVPPHISLLLDVESCSPGPSRLDYTLDLRNRERSLVAFVDVRAHRAGSGYTLSWHTAREARGLVFLVESNRSGTRVLARVRGTTASRYGYRLRYTAAGAAPTFSVKAVTADGSWEWIGPIRPDTQSAVVPRG